MSQTDQRQDLVAELNDLIVVDAVDVGFDGARNFDHGVEGNCVEALLDVEKQGLDDGQGERELEPEGGALAGAGFDLHAALEAVEDALHHVHADTAAGDFGDFLGGAEARAEDEVERVGFGDARAFFRAEQAEFDGLGLDALRVDTAPVIGDFEDDLIALVMGVQAEASAGGLPARSRSAAVSMPWLIALRTRWVKGSAIASRMLLSRSVS